MPHPINRVVNAGIMAGNKMTDRLSTVSGDDARRKSTFLRLIRSDDVANEFGYKKPHTSVHHRLCGGLNAHSLLVFPTNIQDDIVEEYSMGTNANTVPDDASKVEEVTHTLCNAAIDNYADLCSEGSIDVSTPTTRTINPVEGALDELINNNEMLIVVENRVRTDDHVYRHLLAIGFDELAALANVEDEHAKELEEGLLTSISILSNGTEFIKEAPEDEAPVTNIQAEITVRHAEEAPWISGLGEAARYAGCRVDAVTGEELGILVGTLSDGFDREQLSPILDGLPDENRVVEDGVEMELVSTFTDVLGIIIYQLTGVGIGRTEIQNLEGDLRLYRFNREFDVLESDYIVVHLFKLEFFNDDAAYIMFLLNSDALHTFTDTDRDD